MRLWASLLSAIVLSTLSTRTFGLGPSPSFPPPPGGIIIGRVIDANTGKGIGGALVTLSLVSDVPALEPANSPDRTVVTTADGEYGFRNLGPARYAISATKRGYLAGGLGARRPGGRRQLLVLADGEKSTASPITLWKQAAISGIVTDEAGAPIVGARVRALRRTPPRGREFGGESSGMTDGSGRYRIGELPPGDYLVLVSSISNKGSLVYPVTFYGSPNLPELATIVTVAPGDDRTGVKFQLTPASGLRLRGIVQGPSGPAAGVAVTLRWPDLELFPFDLEIATTVSGPDGAFSFNALSGGTYVLRAAERPRPINPIRLPAVGSSTSTLLGSTTIVVNHRDIDDFVLQLRPGARVSGCITFENAVTPQPGPIASTSVWLDRVDDRASEPSNLDRFGQFTTAGLPPGRYRVRVGVIPVGWMFKSAMFEGRDVADEPFELESEDVHGVVVTFSTQGTRLSGVIRSERGQPDPETSVLIYPAIPSMWTPTTSLFRMRSTRPSTTGAYTVTSLPAGEYYVVAVPEEQSANWQDPKRLAKLALHAARVRIVDGEAHVQDLRTVRDR